MEACPIDIQEVFHTVMQEKLELIKTEPIKISWLEHQVKTLEHRGGILEAGGCSLEGNTLFLVEKELALPGNETLRKRWNDALAIGKRIRMELIHQKALRLLEDFEPDEKHPGTAISFARAVHAMTKPSYKAEDRPEREEDADEYDEAERKFGEDRE